MVLPALCRGITEHRSSLLRSLLAAIVLPVVSSQLVAQTHHYEPVPDRMVGIWPADWSVEYLTSLRRDYGLSGVFIWPVPEQHRAAIDAGYPPARIMAALPDSYESFVRAYPAGFYYIDEPAEHDCYGHPSGYQLLSPEELAERTHFIHYTWPGAHFVISGYKRCSHNLMAATNADIFMYSSYHHWRSTSLPICRVNMGYANEWEAPWISGAEDQRDDWTEFRGELGGRFSMTWVHGGGDEYDQLFGHAANLKLFAVWIYNEIPPTPDRLEEICSAAARHGWLTRIEGTPLTVQLQYFRAQNLENLKVRLAWATTSEYNAYGFVLERRLEGNEAFQEVPGGFIPAHGTTLEPQSYRFEDGTLGPGRHWYRLRIKDLDGAEQLSEAISVEVTGKPRRAQLASDRIVLDSYPNPFNPSTTIRFQLPQPAQVDLGVFNILGEKVAALVTGTLKAGSHEALWEASGVASGVYFCRLQALGTLHQERILLVR